MTTPLAEAFRDTMAGVATPVCVVSAMDGVRPHGTTVSAFASLSMDPPMVVVSLDRRSDLLRVIEATGVFGVNMLASDQSTLATAFARKGTDKFADVGWADVDGVPRVAGAAGWLVCRVDQQVAGGDHVLLLGAVRTAHREHLPPLTYHARTFGTHLPHRSTPCG